MGQVTAAIAPHEPERRPPEQPAEQGARDPEDGCRVARGRDVSGLGRSQDSRGARIGAAVRIRKEHLRVVFRSVIKLVGAVEIVQAAAKQSREAGERNSPLVLRQRNVDELPVAAVQVNVFLIGLPGLSCFR